MAPPCLHRMRLGLLLILINLELGSAFKTKKLCGRHLLKEIIKLCGLEDWSLFEGGPAHWQLVPGPVDAVGAFLPSGRLRSGILSPDSTAASIEEAINVMKIRSLPAYQHEKASSLHDEMRGLSPSHTNPHAHKIVEFKKRNANKIKATSNSFWGNHPQRIRRGYSEKCCLKGCTKEELSIACFPYIDYNNIGTGRQF
ncbi:insulin-like peptide INSL6 [Rhynchocyon petersi]